MTKTKKYKTGIDDAEYFEKRIYSLNNGFTYAFTPHIEELMKCFKKMESRIFRLERQVVGLQEEIDELSPKYAYNVIWSEMDNKWIGRCVEFPSEVFYGKFKKETFIGIKRLVAEAVEKNKTEEENKELEAME